MTEELKKELEFLKEDNKNLDKAFWQANKRIDKLFILLEGIERKLEDK